MYRYRASAPLAAGTSEKSRGALNGTAIARALSIKGDSLRMHRPPADGPDFHGSNPALIDAKRTAVAPGLSFFREILRISGLFHGEQSAVFADGITVGHSRDIVGDCPGQVCFSAELEFRWQKAGITQEGMKKVGDNTSGLVTHAGNLVVLVQVFL